MRVEIKAELDRIQKLSKNRLLEPKVVIAAARNPKNPLHGCFTWNAKKAHELNLLREARGLIQEYTVIVTNVKNEPIKVRHYVSLTTDRVNGGGYRLLSDVMNDDDMAEQMLEDALAELAVFQAKYSRLKELRPIFDAIESVSARPSRKRNGKQAEARAQ